MLLDVRQHYRHGVDDFGEALRGKLTGWLRDPAPNNAFLASFATYTDQVPLFEKMLADAGGDLARFYSAVREMATVQSSPGPSSAPSP